MHDKRHAYGVLEEVHLVPQVTFAEHFAMVGNHHNHGIFGQPRFFEGAHHFTKAIINVGQSAVVGMTGAPNMLIVD